MSDLALNVTGVVAPSDPNWIPKTGIQLLNIGVVGGCAGWPGMSRDQKRAFVQLWGSLQDPIPSPIGAPGSRDMGGVRWARQNLRSLLMQGNAAGAISWLDSCCAFWQLRSVGSAPRSLQGPHAAGQLMAEFNTRNALIALGGIAVLVAGFEWYRRRDSDVAPVIPA